ncbi:MAG: hypothetical protein HOC93_07200 [Phycisphaerae bacterium]|jgi:hypothetical protein|nr:hypothetical protein [Phycisphaerae bacterium]HJN71829.1 hypothetical protein [Phycisphaerales bacterium]|tara:strand:+ start:2866 stop:3093 length:228 start_codon:yes stop_codon:yes gene_type:complete
MTDPINKKTNTDSPTRQELIAEARISKNRARVKLLQMLHQKLAAAQVMQDSMETAFGYDPINDNSFTGEFEAIGA